ncbi:uncharacterized protein LOC100373251 [Saccoglossus kowalevskii]
MRTLFKIWNGKREKRKMAFAESVESLLEIGSIKFGKVCTMIVLEEDGSEVDEDEILMEVSKQILLLLAEGERWNKPGAVVTNVASSNRQYSTQSTQSTNENTVLAQTGPAPVVLESTNQGSQDKSMSLSRTVHMQNSSVNVNVPIRTESPNHVDRISFGGRNIYVSGEVSPIVPTTTATPTYVSSGIDMMNGHFCTSENDMGLEVSHYNSSVSSPLPKEDNTEYEKGHKRQSVVQVLNNLSEDVLDQYLETSELDPPRLVLLTLNNIALKRAFVVGHGMTVECKVKNVAEALLVLLATYSVWNLDYPKEYCQALYFFKIALLGESYVDMQYMSSKFRLLLKEYHSKFGIEMDDAPAAADTLNGVLSPS